MEIQDIIQGLTSAEIAAITTPEARTLIVNTTLQQAVIYVNGTFKQASFENTDDIPEGTKKFATTSDLDQINTNASDITSLQTGKEDSFTKNSAFNKNFGTSAGDVLQGDTRTITPTEISTIANQSGTNTGDETDSSIKSKYENNPDTNAFTDAEKTNLSNQSGTNTNDETTSTIQSKRPLKTIEGNSLEGFGDIPINSTPYIKDTLIVTSISSNFNSNVPTDIPDMTYTVSGLSGARDFIFYAVVLTNNDQNEELDFYIAKNGTTDTNQVIIETQRKNQDQSIQGTFELDGLVNGDVITFQFDTRSDNVDIETRRMIIQSWK